MAIARRPLEPKVPAFDGLDLDAVRLDYHAAQDTLLITFSGTSRPAISKFVDDDTIYRLDPVTSEVVGIEVENFLLDLLDRWHPDDDLAPEPDQS